MILIRLFLKFVNKDRILSKLSTKENRVTSGALTGWRGCIFKFLCSAHRIYVDIDIYRVYKKLNPFKFKLSSSYCINFTAPSASSNDLPKHKVLYTWEIDNVIICQVYKTCFFCRYFVTLLALMNIRAYGSKALQ